MQNLPVEVQNIVHNTDYEGYVVFNLDRLFGKTTCPNNAVSMALDCYHKNKSCGDFVKVYRVGAMGKYHHTPGARYCWDFDWNKALRELMYG